MKYWLYSSVTSFNKSGSSSRAGISLNENINSPSCKSLGDIIDELTKIRDCSISGANLFNFSASILAELSFSCIGLRYCSIPPAVTLLLTPIRSGLTYNLFRYDLISTGENLFTNDTSAILLLGLTLTVGSNPNIDFTPLADKRTASAIYVFLIVFHIFLFNGDNDYSII